MRKRGGVCFVLILIFSLFLVYFSSASQIEVTEEHPFLIDNEWIPANQLEIWDLLTTSEGKRVKITNIRDIETEEPFLVYNLEAGEYNDFVVGDEKVVVHNSNTEFVYRTEFPADVLDLSETQKLNSIIESFSPAERETLGI